MGSVDFRLSAYRSFEPEAIHILVSAFEDAWAKIQQNGVGTGPGTRESVAKAIIQATRRGEPLERRKLCDTALEQLAEDRSH